MPPLRIPSPAGFLEGCLEYPPAYTGRWAALLCHPHPMYGGNMQHKVVVRMADALRECGAATLRFNFRGVGRSTGQHAHGAGEELDIAATWAFLRREAPAAQLILGGFSFGAWLALKVACSLPDLRYLLAVGLPIDRYDLSFWPTDHPPLLLIQGSRDEFGNRSVIMEFARSAGDRITAAIIEDADHSFTGRLTPMMRSIGRHFQPLLSPSAIQKPDASTPSDQSEKSS
ncbi:MAG: alpha/beta hydrolase [Acidobacteria bacterium]|nr:alpha/beta hydrolase [Acidobacteriota bacterium]